MGGLSASWQGSWRHGLAGAVTALALVVLADTSGISTPLAHASSPTEELVRRILHEMVSTDARANQSIRKSWGSDITPAQLAVMRPYVRTMFQHPKLAEYLTNRVEALGPTRSLTPNEVMSATANAMLDLQLMGMKRLPSDLQAGYLQYAKTMYRDTSAQECYEMVDPNTTAMRIAEIECNFVKRLPVPKPTEHLRLLERAMLAELNDYPPLPSMNAERARLAQGGL